jgi:mono/diheme cytochrome c family protein
MKTGASVMSTARWRALAFAVRTAPAVLAVLATSVVTAAKTGDDVGPETVPSSRTQPHPGPGLGVELSPAQVATLDRTVFPDGAGLPVGSGSVAEGEALFDQRCAACHGPGGRGAVAPELAGGQMALDSEWPDKTIGTYWPYAPTLFDFIRRAMPLNAPGSLSDDQAYALTAYLLHRNDIVPADTRLDAASLPQVRMPNREGFRWVDVPAPVRP